MSSALADKELNEYSDLEKEGVIQRFEHTFELAWKTFKDYLDFSGMPADEATPRRVIKQCVVSGIFAAAGIDSDVFFNMMLDRNLLSHTYDAERFSEALVRIKGQYLAQLGFQNSFFIIKELENNE